MITAELVTHSDNLLIFIALITYVAKRPIADALSNRSAEVRKQLEEAAKLREDARAEHERLDQRQVHFQVEVEEMKIKAAAAATAEQQQLIERAHEAAERIREAALANIRDETVRAQNTLRKEAVELAVSLAEQTLQGQVVADDQRRLARQFLDSLSEDAHGR